MKMKKKMIFSLLAYAIFPYIQAENIVKTEQYSQNKDKNSENCVITESEQEPIIPITPDNDLTNEEKIVEKNSILSSLKHGFNTIIETLTMLKNKILNLFGY